MRASVRGVLALVVLGLLAAACDPGPSPSPAATLNPGSLGPPVSLPPGATPLVRIDPTLLAILPDSVADHSVLESTEVEGDALANGSLASLSDGMVGAMAIDPGSGDFVIAIVVRLRGGALTDTGFRDWRDTYDAGACGAQGVTGNAQAQIGGRTVYIGTCGSGWHTYHTWIQDRNLLVSASSGGAANLGQLLFEHLRP
ncbi:MAG TPA: hypothetical protein VNH13_01295 [Candidatus Acidoferrales bacterium]|nr:hypothetical protein [Candidatus Acidoferrales bacterium]